MPENVDPTKKVAKEVEEWVEKQKLLQLSEISLILDTYDDIFSDFDPRTLDKRSLSDDFLAEVKHATREKQSGVIEINFLIPLEQRKTDKEVMIKKRLRDHFKKHHDLVEKEISQVRFNGFSMICVGILFSCIAAVFIYPNESTNIISNLILVLIEPAAWFLIWEGANKLFEGWKSTAGDLDFYKKMIKSEINFTSY
jgi:hypothetical protein